ncbi:two-component system sensor kinase and response regulator [Thermotomaculum hydrothermale]|uniref:histidine kinase n=1 Tax=Thermotomaculum hydrothermale TaxID=981385 RepID=A0A7R6PUG5_9BACT|nr:PAS domain S-box protein [Thermotomaculum hydrothermale]BBB32892.1 two-component system sensor kinase and response regulator [Thermotomaculum hydrothermale]
MSGNNIKVLYVDDNIKDREFVKYILTKSKKGFTLFETNNKDEFINILEKEDIDLIITDINIRGLNGLEIIRLAKKKKPYTGVIVLTGTGTEETAVKALKLGADDYILKKTENIKALPNTIYSILKLKQIEKEKRENLNYLKTLTDSLPEVIFDVKLPERIITYATSTIKEVLGYNPEEVIGKTTRIFFENEEDFKKTGEKTIKAIQKGEKSIKQTIPLKTKYGEIIIAEVISTFVKENGKVSKVIDIVRDITKEIEAKKLAQIEQLKYEMLFEASIDTIFIMKESKIINCNKAAEKLYEGKKKDIIGKTPFDLSPEKQENGISSKKLALEKISNALKGIPQRFEWTHKTLKGQLKQCEVSLSKFEVLGEEYLLAIVRDISEKKEMELILKAQNKRLNDIVNLSPAVIYALDVDTLKLTWFSGNMKKILGYSDDEVLKKDWWEKNIYPDDFERLRKERKTARKTIFGEKHLIREYRFYTKERKLIWIRDELIVIEDKDGKPVEILGSWVDITEEKKHQLKVEEEAKKLTAITDNANDAIIMTNKKLEIVFWNKAAEKIFGYNEKEALGENPHLLLSSDTFLKKFKEKKNKFKEKLSHEKSIFIEAKAKTKNGQTITVEISLSKLEMEGEIYFLTVIRDITGKKKLQEEIRREKKLFELTVKSISDGIISLDKNGKVIFANPSAKKFSKTEEIIGKYFCDVYNLKPEETKTNLKEKIKKTLAKGVPYKSERDYFRVNDQNKFLSITINPIKQENEIIGAVVVIKDITDRIKYQKEMARFSKLEAINLLAGGIAHDFNNLLGAMYGYIDLAFNTTREEKTKKYLAKTLKTFERAKSLATRLLTLSKEQQPVKKVQDITSSVVDTIALVTSGTAINISYDIDKEIPTVNIDKAQIEEVIENIAVNAVQAMGGKGELMVSIKSVYLKNKEIGQLKEGNYIKISISDTGPGIPKQILDRIFEPFFTTKENGTGIGLAQCYSIISKHDGWIDVETKEGKGTTFHIYLPVCEECQIPGESGEKKEHTKEFNKKSEGIVLIMDDDDGVREVLKDILEELGYKVIETTKGEEVIEFFENEYQTGKTKVDAMIFDLTIRGGMGGKETIEKIRKVDKDLPVFVISGYSKDPILINPERYGFTAGLPKPFKIENLKELLLKHIRKEKK